MPSMPTFKPTLCNQIDPTIQVNGRGYPDLAVMGHNYQYVLDGVEAYTSYTAATPVVAGMVSLVNAARKAVGKSSLGWINPALYLYAQQFVNDITSGQNNCAAGGEVCCMQGFAAADGWDPVTGLGSVNFTALQSVLVALGNDFSEVTHYPTMTPVALNTPSSMPSTHPTPLPSALAPVSSGWFYYSVYYHKSCAGPPADSLSGFPTQQCLKEYDTNGTAIGSRKFKCGSGKYLVCLSLCEIE